MNGTPMVQVPEQLVRELIADLTRTQPYTATLLTHCLTQPVLPDERELYWKAGFLRGAKFWHSTKVPDTEAWTMWQSEQNECWVAAHQLWPHRKLSSLDDAREICRLHAAEETP